jgi:uncharacterized protein YdiU (UPF0061 family)
LNITGESFDYGPWRFLPASDPSFTAAYFDQTGLYAFGRQPEAVSWALAQFGGALSLVCDSALLEAELARFAPGYQGALRDRMFGRLGLETGELDADLGLLQAMFDWLTRSRAPWDQFFHDWRGGAASAERASRSSSAGFYDAADFAPVRDGLERRTPADAARRVSHSYFQRPEPVTMVIDEVERIWAAIAERDDWAPFEAKLADIQVLREALTL